MQRSQGAADLDGEPVSAEGNNIGCEKPLWEPSAAISTSGILGVTLWDAAGPSGLSATTLVTVFWVGVQGKGWKWETPDFRTEKACSDFSMRWSLKF